MEISTQSGAEDAEDAAVEQHRGRAGVRARPRPAHPEPPARALGGRDDRAAERSAKTTTDSAFGENDDRFSSRRKRRPVSIVAFRPASIVSSPEVTERVSNAARVANRVARSCSLLTFVNLPWFRTASPDHGHGAPASLARRICSRVPSMRTNATTFEAGGAVACGVGNVGRTARSRAAACAGTRSVESALRRIPRDGSRRRRGR